MNKRVVIATVIALAVLTPTAVMAATGSFSSSSSSNALTAVNTGSGKAIGASSITGDTATFKNTATSGASSTAVYATQYSGSDNSRGVLGYANSTGGGTTYGVYGKSNAHGDNASGVYGNAASATGFTNGVLGIASSEDGTGVFGVGPGTNGYGMFGLGNFVGVLGAGFIGVEGDSGGLTAIGDGSYGVLSDSDLGVSGHVMSGNDDTAGTCVITNPATTCTVTFDTAYPNQAPVVIVTPQGDPNGDYWVVPTTGGFTINIGTTPGTSLTFGYFVIGQDTLITPASAGGASALSRQRQAHDTRFVR